MAYASSSDVGALCRNLLGNLTDFTQSSCPTLAQINSWLTTGCALINIVVKGRGYNALTAGTDAYDVAQQANALYAAWLAERSRINARVSADERTRADMMKKDYEYLIGVLKEMDLSEAGATTTGRVYAEGISVSDKASVEGDTDRVLPRFARGQGRNREAAEPNSTGAGDPQSRSTS